MIPFKVMGVVEQFHCSECDWAFVLEEPFFYSNVARRTEESHKVKQWYSAHDCAKFPKPATKIRK